MLVALKFWNIYTVSCQRCWQSHHTTWAKTIWSPRADKQGVLQVAYNLTTTDTQTRCSTSGLQSVHHRQTNKVFYKWPCRKNTIWPPQTEKLFYKWPCRKKEKNNLATPGRQTRCSTGGLQSVHHNRQTNRVFYKCPTLWPPQADKTRCSDLQTGSGRWSCAGCSPPGRWSPPCPHWSLPTLPR